MISKALGINEIIEGDIREEKKKTENTYCSLLNEITSMVICVFIYELYKSIDLSVHTNQHTFIDLIVFIAGLGVQTKVPFFFSFKILFVYS